MSPGRAVSGGMNGDTIVEGPPNGAPWQNWGFDPPQVHLRWPQRRVYLDPNGADAIPEGSMPTWSYWGFDGVWPQPPSPLPRQRRAGGFEVGEPGEEYIFFPIAPQIVNMGFEGVWPQPPFPRIRLSGSIMRGEDGIGAPFFAWQNAGWEVQSVQPPFPATANVALNNRRAGILPEWNVEAVYQNWVNAGWAVQPVQPPKPRPERAGAVEVGEGGIDAIYFQVAPQIVLWGWEGIWPQPPARPGVKAAGKKWSSWARMNLVGTSGHTSSGQGVFQTVDDSPRPPLRRASSAIGRGTPL